ncbi:MAG TPA: DUF3783 domain-containing protein [Deltaproteobacteria bacterium]|nr:DUF3783 domain-containing protein [Deltaproteobacteria bacterium]
MKERIICFALWLSEEDIARGTSSFGALNQGMHTLEVIAVTPTLLGANVGTTLDNVLAGAGPFCVHDPQAHGHALPLEGFAYRVVIMHAPGREQLLQVMRGFKAVLPDPQDMIFAVITDMASTWTFEEYIRHLGSEHEYMKTHDPNENPDMKRM